jgi:hypothetical protein
MRTPGGKRGFGPGLRRVWMTDSTVGGIPSDRCSNEAITTSDKYARRAPLHGSEAFELIQPAVVHESVGPPAHELRRLTQPARGLERGVGHLAHQGGRHASPGRHGVVLPARADGVLVGDWSLENWRERSNLVPRDRPSHAKMALGPSVVIRHVIQSVATDPVVAMLISGREQPLSCQYAPSDPERSHPAISRSNR